MSKPALVVVASILLTGLLPSSVLATRLLPRARPSSSATSTLKTRGITTSVKFRGDRLAIIVNFSNLSIASKVEYVFSYNSRGTTQGASGALNLANPAETRELLFGTCSHGVCRYDTGITNARFVVTTTLKSGKKVVKGYRLKV